MMSKYLFDAEKITNELQNYFSKNKSEISSFGTHINQIFEAYVFTSTVKMYKLKGWIVEIINPKIKGVENFRLKFNTRGRPNNYSYALCKKNKRYCQIRHQLRVRTASSKAEYDIANICCDVAIINSIDLSLLSTDEPINNNDLISFGEAKHMSAYAELIASFIGLVHELLPDNLRDGYRKGLDFKPQHLPPFLYVSGIVYPSAKGIIETIRYRDYNIDIYSHDAPLFS